MKARKYPSCVAVIGAVVALLLGSAEAWAQATAQISGTVKDASGAVLPGATVVATQTQTGIAGETVTNQTGAYVLPNLPIGPYRLEASLQGFGTAVQTGIVLQVNATPVIDIELAVGGLEETVEVQAGAAVVETRTVGVSQVIENARILELPLNGRQVTEAGGARARSDADHHGCGVAKSVRQDGDLGGWRFLDGHQLSARRRQSQ